MDDETQVVPENGAEAQPESTQTTAAQVVTPDESQAAQALSLEQVERLLNEREAKLRAEFEQQTRRAQSKTDKAYADALRKAKVIEESAELLGLEAEQVSKAKAALIDKEFSAAFAEKPNAPNDNPIVPPTPQSDFIARAELAQYVKSQGLEESDVDLAKYAGAMRGDTQLESEFVDDIAVARAKQVEQRRQRKQQQAQAQQAAQVKQQFGKVAPVTAGAPSAGYDPQKELEALHNKPIPDDPEQKTAYKARYKKLLEEVERMERK